jgi:hypothetical protein
MRTITTLSILACAAALVALQSHSQESAPATADGRPLVSIKELMEKTITPATNRLWDAWEPPAEEDWPQLEEAAITLLVATQANALGGTGPMDSEWVQNPAWQAYNQIMLNAGLDALRAIRARDHDALLEAGDVLYPPCESCHLQFNPGVAGQQP